MSKVVTELYFHIYKYSRFRFERSLDGTIIRLERSKSLEPKQIPNLLHNIFRIQRSQMRAIPVTTIKTGKFPNI